MSLFSYLNDRIPAAAALTRPVNDSNQFTFKMLNDYPKAVSRLCSATAAANKQRGYSASKNSPATNEGLSAYNILHTIFCIQYSAHNKRTAVGPSDYFGVIKEFCYEDVILVLTGHWFVFPLVII